uniref:StAR related lipid transfer domain containing 8 n=1 Tax=Salmo trutta TaxID=8032 RepID=A0A674CLI7_SALTR
MREKLRRLDVSEILGPARLALMIMPHSKSLRSHIFNRTVTECLDASSLSINIHLYSHYISPLSRKLRWYSFQNSHKPSLTSASQEINRQSAAQLNLLQKFSLLRLTAIVEKYCEPNKHGWSWSIPKFMNRSKVPDYRDKQVFGVPPIINVKRSGQPLPQGIQQAMRYLRSQCLEKVGIFRKSGVKSRIQTLRKLNENSPDHVSYQGQSAYDVADLLKHYFRDLPEPVLTTKLTDTFLQIYHCVPKDMRLQAAQAAVILLPDENREVLQTLLYFLSDIASAEENQMTAGNLAVCLAPSILHLNVSKKEGTSPRYVLVCGKPDHKDLSENMAASQGLSHMIVECKKLFQVLYRIDDDLLHSRVIEALEDNTKVYHFVTDSMAPHPRRDFVVLRWWCRDLPRGLCLLVSSSVDHDNVHLEAGLRAVLLTSQFLIEPSGMGRSRLTHYCRADLRGRSPEWYCKVFGHLCAVEVARIRGSFPVITARGTETKL